VPSGSLPYRDFSYPLNVFMHILTHEEGAVQYLHYGVFEREDEPLAAAQERSTDLLLSRLPSPPARLLEVGIGLGTTLDRLTRLGYEVEGITPDERQIAAVRARYGDALRVECTSFEKLDRDREYDALVFQESSQYIDSEALFARAERLAPRVVVLDEFALEQLDEPAALHSRAAFLEAAARHGFEVAEEVDLSAQAAPTMDYFARAIPLHRDRLIADLGLTSQQVDDLVASGQTYIERYREGIYGYRLLRLERPSP
jgi:SAM-dependent methyltransferase